MEVLLTESTLAGPPHRKHRRRLTANIAAASALRLRAGFLDLYLESDPPFPERAFAFGAWLAGT